VKGDFCGGLPAGVGLLRCRRRTISRLHKILMSWPGRARSPLGCADYDVKATGVPVLVCNWDMAIVLVIVATDAVSDRQARPSRRGVWP
jgi:hypothetical protein